MDDETQVGVVQGRRETPPFPWWELRELIFLNGYSPIDKSFSPVPMSAYRFPLSIRADAIKRAEHIRALTAFARAFQESRQKHNLTAAHWNIFMACELGLVFRTVTASAFRDKEGKTFQKVSQELCVYNPDREDGVMPYDEAARTFSISSDRVPRYHRDARTAIEKEWNWIHQGYEG